MYTYQDLLVTDDMSSFIKRAILGHKNSNLYRNAIKSENYASGKNETILAYEKIIHNIKGEAVPDTYRANHKCLSNFHYIFITQENQYLLGNGCQFNNDETKDKLGGYKFDKELQKLGKWALIHGVSFGFFNYDRIQMFKLTEFVPLYDEEDGGLKAGIRFWQIDYNKPMRATLYELDGYTDYIMKKPENEYVILHDKRDYKQIVRSSVVDGTEIYNNGNYPNFPIIPLWGNEFHESDIRKYQGSIDAYDLIKSGFANDLDDASLIYWIIQNAGGMDDVDLVKFIERLHVVHAAVVEEDGAKAEPHTIDIPYQSRETYLTRLENDLYRDAMALNVRLISGGDVTATAVYAAYEMLSEKTDEFEYNVGDFIHSLLELIGVEDAPTFKRSKVSNMAEETSTILMAGEYLDHETILNKLPFVNPDEVKTILERSEKEEAEKVELIQQNQNLQEQDEEKKQGIQKITNKVRQEKQEKQEKQVE